MDPREALRHRGVARTEVRGRGTRQLPRWAVGECANNPAYMLGGETPGSARSCCAGDVGTRMPEMLSAWQRIFCASCPGTQWEEDVRAADASER